ncbi:hypothetical protein [Ferrimonas aestuarii]|uniref:Uncharacterized protein n=1 Tax=Ferrimonas aestuarii TaxID=2569539 RepID=A0A4U1BHQ4_9GAMM|nr:hypothetical protein [Ferrimonas aestuarii]TKB50027.1 hypothetical protein FCL42_19775 [Ferrimonas aestuarii]
MLYLPLLIPLYALFFYIVLKWLHVENERVKRSFILSLTLLITQLIGATVAAVLELADNAVPLISIGLFVLIVNRFLTLKWWQAILIPIGVTMASSLVAGVGFMIFFKSIASS